MRTSGALIAIFVALSPCAFAQEKAPQAPAAAQTPATAVPAPAVQDDKPLPLDDRPKKPLDEKAAQEREKAERGEQQRAAAEKRALDYKLYKEELFRQCTILPVMSDEQIDACKKAYRA
jgi:hypothetical protein